LKQPALSVVICTCERYDVLPGAVASVLQQAYRPLELVVVDNSADRAAALAFGERYRGNDKIRYAYEPLQGLSRARNKGVALSRGDIVAFIDDDAVAEPGWAEAIVRAFQLFPNAGYAGGRVVPRWLAPRPEWLTQDLLGYLSIVDWGGTIRKLRRGEWLAGCNIAFEREALTKAGGFPLDLGRKGTGPMLLSNEEIKLCEAIRSTGKIGIYAPAAIVGHLIGPERLNQSWFLRRAAWQAVSDFIASPGMKGKAFSFLASLKNTLVRRSRHSQSMSARVLNIYSATLRRLHGSPRLIENIGAENRDFLKDSLRITIE
jgi:glycosyltransferase involved in cell wall biosynthesis